MLFGSTWFAAADESVRSLSDGKRAHRGVEVFFTGCVSTFFSRFYAQNSLTRRMTVDDICMLPSSSAPRHSSIQGNTINNLYYEKAIISEPPPKPHATAAVSQLAELSTCRRSVSSRYSWGDFHFLPLDRGRGARDHDYNSNRRVVRASVLVDGQMSLLEQ